MPRADLLALTSDDLAAFTNRGTVKRAEREAAEMACTLEETDGGDATFTWADAIVCKFAAGNTVKEGRCTCPAVETCRHLVRSVLYYQKHAKQTAPAEQAGETAGWWNPGDLSDDELARHYKPAQLTRLRSQFDAGQLMELVRGPKPSAYFHDPPCLLRFLVPNDVRYVTCDCSYSAPCSHVPLAVWGFRKLNPQAESGLVATESAPLPIPIDELDEAEETLLAWTEAGFAGAGDSWMDRLTRLERRLFDAGLVWPAEVLADLHQQFDRYVRRDATFQPGRIPELVGEFLLRTDSIRRPSLDAPQLFLRGSAADRPLEVGSARCIGLGCDVRMEKKSVELAAYLQDSDTGSVVAITRDFPDPDDAEPRSFAKLAETHILKGSNFRQVGAGQILIQGGKRNADHRLVVGRAKANVNPQAYQWEKLRAPVLAENFGEVLARLAMMLPASLRPRRMADHLHAWPVTRVENVAFDPASHCVIARLIDASGQAAHLQHPFTVRGSDGAEALLASLSEKADKVRFVAGVARAAASGLIIHPTCVVFAEGDVRSAIQPWIDVAKQPAASGSLHHGTKTGDDLRRYISHVQEFLADTFVSGLARADALTLATARELAGVGDTLGFSRFQVAIASLASHLDQKTRSTRWDFRPAGRAMLLQAAILRMSLDVSG